MILLATLFAVVPALAVDLTIEFRPGGRCTVTTAGESPRRIRVVDVPAPAPPPSEYRCAISPRPQGQSIRLVVTLPQGDTAAGADFPRLTWTERDGRWVGS